MKCPSCQTECAVGMKFCGTCGCQLEKACSQCGMTNPPDYNFCSQCGHNLATAGVFFLLRSGLIERADGKALQFLGLPDGAAKGKPFSLFVAREDLAILFSHWNELLSTSEGQAFEVGLKHTKGETVYARIESRFEEGSVDKNQRIHLSLNDITNRRMDLNRMQRQQDLLNLIFTLAEDVNTATGGHKGDAITTALKKVTLFTEADRAFIYRINAPKQRMEIGYQWNQPHAAGGSSKQRAVTFSMIGQTIKILRTRRRYIVDDVSTLVPAERYELPAWHCANVGAVMSHLLYQGGHPVGVIGVAKDKIPFAWPKDSIELVKLFGQLVVGALPLSTGSDAAGDPGGAKQTGIKPAKKPCEQSSQKETIELQDISIRSDESCTADSKKPETVRPTEHMTTSTEKKPGMRFKQLPNDNTTDSQTVYSRDDSLILVTCPHCGFQETVSRSPFEKFGNTVTVQCTCDKHFSVMHEQRRAYRKEVRLNGYYYLTGDKDQSSAKAAVCGHMVVKNLSKTGLKFVSKHPELLKAGDRLSVRFNLDNSNRSLIEKLARVKFIHENAVGCQFEGADRYDITLGFYFL